MGAIAGSTARPYREIDYEGRSPVYNDSWSKLPRAVVVDKIRGVIYGQAIGDALGLGTEFMNKAMAHGYYPGGLKAYKDIYQDRHRNRWLCGDWTDDTDQAILIMASLSTNKGKPIPGDLAHRLLAWKKSGFKELGDIGGMGIGRTTSNVLTQPRFVKEPHKSADDVWQASGRQVAANGAIMRTGICGTANFDDLDTVAWQTRELCLVTHADPRCVASCVVVTIAIAMMLRGDHDAETQAGVTELIKESSKFGEKALANSSPGLKDFKFYMNVKSWDELKLDDHSSIGYTLKAMGAGVFGLRTSTDFRATITDLIMEGGDADSNASVCGALLGCKVGYSGLPPDLRDGLVHAAWLDKLIAKYLDMMGLAVESLPATMPRIDSAEPADATSSAGPADATSSAGPADATSSAGPADVTSSAGPADATSSAGPADATSSAGPADVTSSAGPADATSSAGPADATSPAGPADATSSAGPADATSSAGPADVTSSAEHGSDNGNKDGNLDAQQADLAEGEPPKTNSVYPDGAETPAEKEPSAAAPLPVAAAPKDIDLTPAEGASAKADDSGVEVSTEGKPNGDVSTDTSANSVAERIPAAKNVPRDENASGERESAVPSKGGAVGGEGFEASIPDDKEDVGAEPAAAMPTSSSADPPNSTVTGTDGDRPEAEPLAETEAEPLAETEAEPVVETELEDPKSVEASEILAKNERDSKEGVDAEANEPVPASDSAANPDVGDIQEEKTDTDTTDKTAEVDRKEISEEQGVDQAKSDIVPE